MKALKIVGGIVALVVIGLVVFAMTFDIGKYKGLIQDQAKAATGREVTIGEIHMAISLTPTVILKDIAVSNAPWGSRPQMLTVKSIEAKAELLPLLSKQLNISKIVLDGADVLLESNKQGKGNWEFETPESKNARTGSQQQAALNISAIQVSDMKVGMKDGKTGGDMEMSVKSAALKISGPLQQMNVSNISISGAQISQREGENAIAASIGKLDIESAGPIADLGLKKIDVSEIKVNGKQAGTPIEAEVSKMSLDEKGALDLEAKYNGGEIRAKGTLAPVSAMKGGQKALPAKLSLEGMGLKADVDVVVSAMAKPPSIKGTINIPEIDLAKFASPATVAAAKAPASKAPPVPKTGPMFSNDPLPWDSLHQADADVKLTIGTVKLVGGQTLTNVSLPIKLEKGHLVLTDGSVELAGGKIVGNVDANAATKAIAIKGGVQNLTAESLAKTYKVTDLITNGPIDAAIDLHGAGASPHAIASSLNGTVVTGLGESRIRNDALKMVGAEVIMQILSAINPLGNKDPYTVARCAVVNMQVTNGVANTQNGIAMVTDKMSLIATGKVDLGQERVDMIVKPQASGVIGQGIGKIVSAVKVSGPMASPNIGLDAASTAKAVGGLAGTVATGGLLGAVAGVAGGGLLGGGDKAQASGGTQVAAAGDPCVAARNWNRK